MDSRGLIAGALSGMLASAPMIVVMEGIRRRLPLPQRARKLPPYQITMEMADTVDLKDELNSDQRVALTAAGHFGYGAMSGAVYGLAAHKTKVSPVVSGAAAGIGLWAVSYMGWLPAVGIRRNATREPAGINAMMIGSHLVWGIITAAVYDGLRDREENGDR